MGKRLHDLLVFDHLIEITRLLRAGIRKGAEHAIGPGGDHARADQRNGREQNHHKPGLPIDREHEDKRAENRHNARKEL